MKKKVALITGITGQDGYYLTKLLLDRGYEVHGLKRRTSVINTSRLDAMYHDSHLDDTRLYLHFGDTADALSMARIINKVAPDEIYNLAAQSHVRVSFDVPEFTTDSIALGALRLLEVIRSLNRQENVRIYQASSSEMFGKHPPPQSESTPFEPQSPYAVAKVFAYWIARNYRESHGIFASNGILFNHESPMRGETFITRKVAIAVAKIKHGLQDCLYLGNLNAQRDWGHAQDYVYGMYLIMQHDQPDDFVLATGVSHSVRHFVERSFELIDCHIVWENEGVDEIGVDRKTGKTLIKIDPRYFRPQEVDALRGDASKARRILGWEPKTNIDELIQEMVTFELDALS